MLRVEVAADTFALVREALAHLSQLSGSRLDDDAALLAMARAVLGGPAEAGRASYQIGLSVCVRCGAGEQPAAGQVVRVEPEVVAMACCDAEQVGWVGAVATEKAGPGGADGTGEPESDGRGATHEPDRGGGVLAGKGGPPSETLRKRGTRSEALSEAPSEIRSEAPGDLPSEEPGESHTEALPELPRQTPSENRSDEPAPKPQESTHVGTRLSRSISRAVRRQVLHRDHRCCSVPGCRNTRFLDLHHLVPRCEGGKHTAQVLLTLCGVHHRAVHRGELIIEGTSVEHEQFLHADGTPYGGGLNVAAVDAHAKVFSALRNLGFREKEVRVVLGALREDLGTRQLEVGPLLRQALARLGPSAAGAVSRG